MAVYEDTNARDLKELLTQIDRGEAALPDFQRDFVWDPHAVQDLLASIASDYPAGSLLRIRNSQGYFAAREFEGAPPLKDRKTTYLVLDGQQRLTSLYQAFYGVGEYRYYLNLRRLVDGEEFADCLFHVRANQRRAQEYEDLEAQARYLILPLSLLQGGVGQFNRWSRRIVKLIPAEERDAIEDALSDVEERWVETIDDYRFPVVTLSDKTSVEAICTIFEAVNRVSVRLSPFELLTARFRPGKVNLRDLWADAQARYPILHEYDVDPYTALQVVSLVGYSPPTCKRRDVLNLDANDIRYWWDRAIAGLAAGLTFIRDHVGVAAPDLLPYPAMIAPLAAVLSSQPEAAAGPETSGKLSLWFWRSVFGQVYESAPTVRAAEDVTALQAWLAGGEMPDGVALFQFNPASLAEITPRQRGLYRGVLALLAARGPRSLRTAEPLTREEMEPQPVFPEVYLRDRGAPARLRESALNRALVDRRIASKMRAHPPSEYIAEAGRLLTSADLAAVLDSLLLPGAGSLPEWGDDYNTFLAWRQHAVGAAIQQVTAEEAAPESPAPVMA